MSYMCKFSMNFLVKQKKIYIFENKYVSIISYNRI